MNNRHIYQFLFITVSVMYAHTYPQKTNKKITWHDETPKYKKGVESRWHIWDAAQMGTSLDASNTTGASTTQNKLSLSYINNTSENHCICNVCGNISKNSAHAAQHSRTHTEAKDYCHICKCNFISIRGYNKHTNSQRHIANANQFK